MQAARVELAETAGPSTALRSGRDDNEFPGAQYTRKYRKSTSTPEKRPTGASDPPFQTRAMLGFPLVVRGSLETPLETPRTCRARS